MNSDKMLVAAQQAHKAGKLSTAEERYKDLLRSFPDYAEGWHFLGLLYSQKRQYELSVEAILKSVNINPGNPVVLTNLGEAYLRSGDAAAAIAALERAIALQPDMAQAHFNLANIFKKANRLDDAIERYKAAVNSQPKYAEAWFNLGNTFMARGMFRSATKAFESAIAIRPDHADARMNLGVAFSELGEVQKAVNRYRDALEQQPNFAEAHRNLGYALEKQGNIPAAMESFSKALELDPANELFRLHVETICPPVFKNQSELDSYRYNLRQTLDQLSDTDFSLHDIGKGEAYFPSLIAYQGGNDLALKKQWSAMFERHFQPKRIGSEVRSPGQPIRVGFVVTHGHEGVFLKCMRGIINRLPDKGHFEVYLVCSQMGGVEILSEGIVHSDVRFLPLQSELDAAAETVRVAEFDILHYWEVGTDSLNYFLPFYGLAPVQCATWGWPTTTGIAQMDYFISSELLETGESDEYYSEKLVRLDHLPTYYHPPPVPENPRPRAAFGLGARDHIYLCTQNLRKVHPDMDRLLEGILQGDPQGRVLFIQDAQPGVTDLLRKRFLQSIPDVANRIQFLPRRPENEYLNIVALADVILDTLHYCGGANTTYDAFATGTPIVTLPMSYHRGRYTAAAYRQMGLLELIANSAKDYVDLALELGMNTEYRAAMSAQITDKAVVLFEDEDAVDELARFFESVA